MTVGRLRQASTRSWCRALLLSLWPALLFGGSRERFGHVSVEDGLSQASVRTILQDHEGFLWFGTEEGLNRYDGHGFVVLKHDAQKPHSLPNDMVLVLHEDQQRRLWVGTDRGLSVFDRRTET